MTDSAALFAARYRLKTSRLVPTIPVYLASWLHGKSPRNVAAPAKVKSFPCIDPYGAPR